MITLTEHVEIAEKMKLFEGTSQDFTDEQLDNASFYKLVFNKETGMTVLYLFDDAEQLIGSCDFDDAEVAIVFIQELFDLDDEDLEYLESYAWADEEEDVSAEVETESE